MLKTKRKWCVSTIGWLLTGLFIVCATVGCGGNGDPATLSGKVTYDGQPIAKGNIRLQPTGETEAQAAAGEIVDGSYEVSEGLVAGQYKVMITATRPATAAEIAAMRDPEEEKEEEEPDEEEAGPQAPSEPMVQYIPPKHGFGSTLTVNLKPGENTKDFDLQP